LAHAELPAEVGSTHAISVKRSDFDNIGVLQFAPAALFPAPHQLWMLPQAVLLTAMHASLGGGIFEVLFLRAEP